MGVKNFKETRVYNLAFEIYKALSDKNQETGRLLGHMINNSGKY
jgi:hypothetical protein